MKFKLKVHFINKSVPFHSKPISWVILSQTTSLSSIKVVRDVIRSWSLAWTFNDGFMIDCSMILPTLPLSKVIGVTWIKGKERIPLCSYLTELFKNADSLKITVSDPFVCIKWSILYFLGIQNCQKMIIVGSHVKKENLYDLKREIRNVGEKLHQIFQPMDTHSLLCSWRCYPGRKKIVRIIQTDNLTDFFMLFFIFLLIESK